MSQDLNGELAHRADFEHFSDGGQGAERSEHGALNRCRNFKNAIPDFYLLTHRNQSIAFSNSK